MQLKKFHDKNLEEVRTFVSEVWVRVWNVAMKLFVSQARIHVKAKFPNYKGLMDNDEKQLREILGKANDKSKGRQMLDKQSGEPFPFNPDAFSSKKSD